MYVYVYICICTYLSTETISFVAAERAERIELSTVGLECGLQYR